MSMGSTLRSHPAGETLPVAELAQSRLSRDCIQWFTRERQWINEQHVQLCRIPAPTFLEGKRAEALATLREFTSRPFDPEGVSFMARNFVRLDQHASALDLLERIVQEGFVCFPILLRDPWLDPIRGERRFNAIVARARERSQDAEAEFHRLGGDRVLASI